MNGKEYRTMKKLLIILFTLVAGTGFGQVKTIKVQGNGSRGNKGKHNNNVL